MDLFVYSDESGVFDRIHNDYFVFGGLILLGNEAKDIAIRKYIAAERALRQHRIYRDEEKAHPSLKLKAQRYV